MSVVAGPPPSPFKTPDAEATLRRLFMTLFLRGHSSRMQTKQTTPKTVVSKLWTSLIVYAFFGAFVLFTVGQPVLLISIMAHSMTFVMLGLLLAAAAGEVLFNKEEAEILMHRPVTSQMLLRAKAVVLVQITLYMAGAMNLVAFFVGALQADRGWLFPIAHAISTVESAFFCIGVVVLGYQLCLRWIGREKLDSVMTTMQVVVVVAITAGSQILPRAISWNGGLGSVNLDAWWLKILPPTWFASTDDALAGSGKGSSWALAAGGLAITCLILWFAFGKLASVYEEGWQAVNEGAPAKAKERSQYQFLRSLSQSAPIVWFLRSSISRASFRLVSAYLLRDRETKLRVYPAVAPLSIMMIVMMLSNRGFGHAAAGHAFTRGFGQFSVAFGSAFLCLVPISVLELLKYSQQWRATETFVVAPLTGPQPILQGARVAVVLFLCLPPLLILVVAAAVLQGLDSLWLVLPGVIALPAYTLIPSLLSNPTPLSNPIEQAQSAKNVPVTMGSMFVAMITSGLATGAKVLGLLPWFLLIEACASAGICFLLWNLGAKAVWRSLD